MSVVVRLDRPPHTVRLVAWGRADDGWWAGIFWDQRARPEKGGVTELATSAWVPAASIRPRDGQESGNMPRLILPSQQRMWPAPPTAWPCWYAGLWSSGPLAMPTGLDEITGPSWREKRQ